MIFLARSFVLTSSSDEVTIRDLALVCPSIRPSVGNAFALLRCVQVLSVGASVRRSVSLSPKKIKIFGFLFGEMAVFVHPFLVGPFLP